MKVSHDNYTQTRVLFLDETRRECIFCTCNSSNSTLFLLRAIFLFVMQYIFTNLHSRPCMPSCPYDYLNILHSNRQVVRSEVK